jgi:hypothetical protein
MSSTLLYAVAYKEAANESVYVIKLQYIYASINTFRAPSSGLWRNVYMKQVIDAFQRHQVPPNDS